jgi:beta-galactosidase
VSRSARNALRGGGLWFGGDYNPEQWDPVTWADDDELMRRARVNTATVGVFSWALLEPEEGKFEFGWLDDTLGRLHASGVRVILATPTASPPPWFTLAYPDAMPVRPDGTRLWHGSRDTYCAAAPAYRQAARRIAGELGRRYGDHPALAMWHVHNEYGTMCWCDHVAAAFRSWLRARYGGACPDGDAGRCGDAGLAALNQAWGTAFWSQRYSSWGQVLPPRATQYRPNPGQELDFRRFWSDELLAAYTEQRDLLRLHAPGIPVTTNFMGPDHLVVDPWSWGREVDAVAVDHYLSTAEGEAGHADIAFVSDWARGIGRGRPWLLMEQAPSTVTDDGVLVHRAPGRMLADSLGYVARGADGVLFFQWRASRAGAEMYHPALVPHAGPDTRIFREAVALGEALERISEVAGSTVTSDAAVLVDAASRWALETQGLPSPHVRHLDVARAVHAALRRSGAGCDIAPPGADLSGYRLVVVPAVYLLSDAAAAALREYAEGGGHLAVTFCSGIADQWHRIRTGGYPGALRDVLGIRIEEFHPLHPGTSAPLTLADAALGRWGQCDAWSWPRGEARQLTGRLWTERLRTEGAEVLAAYAAGALAGVPAITRRPVGAGTAWYLSTLPPAGDLATVLRGIAAAAGILPAVPAPSGVCATRRRDGHGRSWLCAVSHSAVPVTLPAFGLDLVTGREIAGALDLPAGGIAVIREAATSPLEPAEHLRGRFRAGLSCGCGRRCCAGPGRDRCRRGCPAPGTSRWRWAVSIPGRQDRRHPR